MHPQLLDLFKNKPSFSNFIAFNNEMVVNSLQHFSNQFTHLVGARYSGKTHILKSWVNLAIESGKPAIYIDSNDISQLRDLAQTNNYIAVDNIEFLSEEKQIELFDLFNSIKLTNSGNNLLTSSCHNLTELTNLREDLKTRLLSGINLPLKALDDSELLEAIAIFTGNEGITLPEAEKNYLITHYTRSIGALIAAIHHLAERAVLEKRNITIPFIKQVLS